MGIVGVNDDSTARTCNRILDIFVSIGIFLLVWGLFLQIARMFQISFSQLGLVATSVALAITVFYLIRKFRDVDRSSLLRFIFREEGWLLIITLGIGIVRFFMLFYGSDALIYLSGPAYHLANPDIPLRFDTPGHYMSEFQPLVGYWIPCTVEYFLAYVSLISTVPLAVLCFRLMPAIAIVLAIWSIYCLLLTFGASRRSGFFFTIATSGLLMFSSFVTWWALIDPVARAFFTAFILNIMLCFVLKIQMDTDKAKVCWQALLFSAGFALTSQTGSYLIIAAAGIFLIASLVTNQIQKRRRQYVFDVFLFISLAAPAIVVIVVTYFMGTIDLYEFVLFVFSEQGISDPFSSFQATWNVLFNKFHFGHLVTYISFLGLNIFICCKYRDWRSIFFLIFSIIYIFFVLNPLAFQMFKLSSTKYRVFWRFYYLFPVMLYPAVVFLMCWSSQKKLLIGIGALLYVSLFVFFVHAGMETTKVYFNRSFSISMDVNSNHEYSSKWLESNLGKPVDRLLLFAYKRAACHYAVFSPGTVLLSSKYQFLPLCFPVKDALDITWAQEALSQLRSLNAKQADALESVLNKYHPDIVVARQLKSGEPPARLILQQCGYSFRKWSHQEALYSREYPSNIVELENQYK